MKWITSGTDVGCHWPLWWG